MLRHECYLLRAPENGPESIRDTLIDEKNNGLTVKTGLFKRLLDEGTTGYAELGPYRQLGDKHSWIQDLDTTGISPSFQAPDIVLDQASFTIGNSRCERPASCLILINRMGTSQISFSEALLHCLRFLSCAI